MGEKPFSRTATDVGGGTPGVSIPKNLREMYDVSIGDELPIDFNDGRLEIVLED